MADALAFRREGTIRFGDAERWLFDAALPFWHANGIDRIHGGFVERLDLFGSDPVAVKRTRAQCRQVYCFAQGAQLGFGAGAEAAEHGWRFLRLHHRREDGAWVRSVTSEGRVVDPRFDAYDAAFVLFAHAAYYRLSGEPRVIDGALRTLDRLEGILGRGRERGFDAAEGASPLSLQNPNMHLFEAAIELADASGHERFRDLAAQLAALFRLRLLDDDRAIVREVYARDWSVIDAPEGRVAEPGHAFEWAWLLVEAERRLGIRAGDIPQRLYARATETGVNAQGLVIDAVDADGAVLSARARLWPQTERLKAALVLGERAHAAQALGVLLDRYLDRRGTWCDQLDAAGAPVADRIPSTSFYHIMMAMSEAIRLRVQFEDRRPASIGAMSA